MIYAVVELETDDTGRKYLSDTRVFTTRDKGLEFLRQRYAAVKERAVNGGGAGDYSDDGWYHVVDSDGSEWEGYLSEGMLPDGAAPSQPDEAEPQTSGRTDSEILKELMDAVMEYNHDRDEEWIFVDDHGYDDTFWNDEQVEEHEQILADIQWDREHIRDLLREATGDKEINF